MVKRAFKYRFYPTFKSKRKSRASAEYTRSACRFRDGALALAKMAELLDIRWSRPLVVVDRWFPSSKACSACGAVRDGVPLRVREWTCRCGATHDRDVNAARNIRSVGLAVLACGDGVRPARAEAHAGSRL